MNIQFEQKKERSIQTETWTINLKQKDEHSI